MVLHVVMFRFKGAVGARRRAALLARAREVLAPLPGVRHFFAGRAIRDDIEFSHAIGMFFADEATLDAYRAHPAHIAFRDDEFVPLVEHRQSFDYADG
jgi:hypothetical protein